MPVIIDATYLVVTPLFCAGADPNTNEPELRVPSFKGALRFWWRALAWARCGGNLAEIKRQEDRLFGSAGGGQSLVSMRIASYGGPAPQPIGVGTVLEIPGSKVTVDAGARYLGYGLMEAFGSKKKGTKAGQLTRACLPSPFEFTVQMRCRGLGGTEFGSLKSALIALGTLGGMGARSRKGYGSIALQSLCVDGVEEWSKPETADQLCQEIGSLPNNANVATLPEPPEFTALSGKARHVLVSSNKKEPLELLDLVGRELVRFRSSGRNRQVLGKAQNWEGNFDDDHDLMQVVHQQPPTTHPRRIAFGLPHNYHFGSVPGYGTVPVTPSDRSLDRRASPLFIHIHECSNGPVAILSFLPARFLPGGRSDISVGGSRVSQTPESNLYRPVHDFLDRMLNRRQGKRLKRKEPFTYAKEVR